MIQNVLIDMLGRRKDKSDWRCSQPSVDLASVETFCILHHNNKAGDAILISLLVDALARARPELKIYVGATAEFAAYWSKHPDVAEVIVYDAGRRRPALQRARQALRAAFGWRDRFDVAVLFQPFARLEHFALLRFLRPRILIGFNKDVYRLFDYSLEEHRQGVDLQPIAMRTRSIMRVFGVEVDPTDLRPHVPFGSEDEARALEALAPSSPGPRLLLNAYGAAPSKRLSPASVARIVAEARHAGHRGPIFVSVPRGKERDYEAALGEPMGRDVKVLGPMEGLSPLCALVASVDLVVSPDTAVGHIAAAFRKPQVCLFACRGSVPVTWRPLSDLCVTLVPPTGDDVNGIDWDEFGQAIATTLSLVGASLREEPLGREVHPA